MRILAWNCQGAGAKLTSRRLEEMCRMYSPSFFLSETKNDVLYLQNMQVSLGFDSLFTVDPVGNSGGLDRMIDIETIIDGN